MKNFTIESSIKQDIYNKVVMCLLKNDYEYKHDGNTEKEKYEGSILALLNAIDKSVPPLHYKVHYSKELSHKMADEFDEKINSLIKLFETKFTNGANIELSLSRKVFDSQFYDVLYNVWNIKHLHLCDKEITNKSQMKNNRSPYLLFFVNNNDNIYFLDVRNHPKADEFVSRSFLDILKSNNWLDIIGVEELVEAIDFRPNISNDKELYKLYTNNINASLFNLGGRIYMLLNAISTKGNRISHTHTLIRINRQIDIIAQNYTKYVGFDLTLNDVFGIVTVKKQDRIERLPIYY